jgi:hypothetical protein
MGSSTTVLPHQDRRRRRRRRQGLTFAGLLALVPLAALAALGNWFQWWSFGPSGTDRPLCPVQTVSAPDQTPVNVYNATDRHGLAAAVAKELQRRHFRVLLIGNTETPGRISTAVSVRYGAGDEIRGRTVAAQFPGEVRLLPDARIRTDHTVDVVIGAQYRAMQERAQAAAAIAPVPVPRGCRRTGA